MELTQALASVPDEPEPGDQFGFSLAVYDANLDGCSDLVVGIPYEDIGPVKDGGSVHLLYGATTGLGSGVAAEEFCQGTVLSGYPQPTDGIAQNTTGVASEPEISDGFGTSLAMVPHRPSGAASTTESLLAVGVPNEDTPVGTDMGVVHIFRELLGPALREIGEQGLLL
ncbi:FG-GAP repeat protein [Streptomyces sp. NPDC059861]|uniref:FG-GAP repeat protein n=1 Tax=Streptomyces sp. NPDC059861 TaxID=3346974 RepID=UPI00364F30A2